MLPQGLDLDGLDNSSGGVFGGNPSWGSWGGGLAARSMSTGTGGGVGFSALDAHSLGTAGSWPLNSQGVVGGAGTFQLPSSKVLLLLRSKWVLTAIVLCLR